MDIRKFASYLIVAALGMLLWNAWIKDYPPASVMQQTAAVNAQTATTYVPNSYDPTQNVQNVHQTINNVQTQGDKAAQNLVWINTDVFKVAIDRNTANVVQTYLLKYPVSLEEKDQPVQLFQYSPDTWYTAEAHLTNLPNDKPINFTTSATQYTLSTDQNQLTVVFQGKTANGLAVTKAYTFKRGNYAIELAYNIKNNTAKPWTGSLYTQLVQRRPSVTQRKFYQRSYQGASISSPEIPYQKLSYETLAQNNLSRDNQGGWVAMQQPYFLSAWIPANPQNTYHYYTHFTEPNDGSNPIYVIGFVNPAITVAPNQSATTQATLYAGPEITQQLKVLAPGLDHTIDYGWLWPISSIIFWLMAAIEKFVRNWGWSTVITTIIIKVLFYGLSASSFRSMARMRELQPRLAALKERYGDDKQAMSQAMMDIYRKEKINPLGGCLPMIIQIPVFIALYYVLIESVQLRQAPFIFWIHDLSVKDPYYILPILMGLSMLLQQKLTPAPDPTQAKMMMFLPIVFTVFFVNFPAGLVLYWLVNNCVQVLQQWYVMKTYDSHLEKKKNKRKNRKK